MVMHLDNNQIKCKELRIPVSAFYSNGTFIVKSVHENKAFNEAEKKYTGPTESVTYTVVHPETLASFKVKVMEATPVISQKELEGSEKIVQVLLPLEETFIQPYEINYGVAKVSIVAPSIKRIPSSAK